VDNSIALVTGANKGIGKEIARQLAGAGLTVYVGSRDAARGERAVEEIGGDARLLVLDVTRPRVGRPGGRQLADLV
jgi:NAD(P)-dependent dehydrogenase (short-subunit alcohol dehydrogenase family)